jgi:hypothetical protein
VREELAVIDALCALHPTGLLASANPATETVCCDEQAHLVSSVLLGLSPLCKRLRTGKASDAL